MVVIVPPAHSLRESDTHTVHQQILTPELRPTSLIVEGHDVTQQSTRSSLHPRQEKRNLYLYAQPYLETSSY